MGKTSRDAQLEALEQIARELDQFESERLRLERKWSPTTGEGLFTWLRTPVERELEARKKGENALARLNDERKLRREELEDKRRRDVQARLQAGKSYQQIALHLGWSKTKVADAVKRWGLTPTRRRKSRSGQ